MSRGWLMCSPTLTERRSKALPHWFLEKASSGHILQWRIKDTLFSGTSRFQKIEIVEIEPFGRALILDGVLQSTEGDEYIYHEMLACVPLAAHPEPRRVLIVGGGDGGLATAILRDRRVQDLTIVEIDEEVVRVSREYLPHHTSGLDDPRLNIIFMDGADFLRETHERFDLILADSTDPDTLPGKVLYTSEFHQNIRRSLNDGGAYVQQSGSPFHNPGVLADVSRDVSNMFPRCQVYWCTVPTYPGAFFTFTAGTTGLDLSSPKTDPPWTTRWYTPQLHRAAFTLPWEVEQLLPLEAKLFNHTL